MLVKPVELATILRYSESGISLAIKRKKIERREDGYIDLTTEDNYKWLCTVLAKQGREIPQKISTLFEGLRHITDNDNEEKLASTGISQAGAADMEEHTASGGGVDNTNTPPKLSDSKTLSKVEQNKIAIESTETERSYRYWRAKKQKEEYLSVQIKNDESRGLLIQINPLGRFLEAIIEGGRNAIINSITSNVRATIDIIKNGLELDKDGKRIKEDSELILEAVQMWTENIKKIFISNDTDLKSRIKQMKIDIKTKEKIGKGKDKNE